jgi:hypothetical protein
VCLGASRSFIKSTGSCLCQAGYRPKNGADETKDSGDDCELIVKETCAAGQEVDVEGNCVEDATALCTAQCGDAGVVEGGGLVQGTGLCECATVQDADAACDATCRGAALEVTLGDTGLVTLKDPTTGAEASFDPSEAPGYRGAGGCSSGGSC